MKMKHFKGCPGVGNYCRCDEVDLTLRLSPEAQLDAMAEAEHMEYLRKTEDPGAEWLSSYPLLSGAGK